MDLESYCLAQIVALRTKDLVCIDVFCLVRLVFKAIISVIRSAIQPQRVSSRKGGSSSGLRGSEYSGVWIKYLR